MDTQRVVVFGKGLGSVPVTQNAGAGELRCSVKGVVLTKFYFLIFR
jgi:hypothetical protein